MDHSGSLIFKEIQVNQGCLMVHCWIHLPAGKEYLYQSSIVAVVPLLAVELLLLMVHLWPFLDGHINAFYWLHED